jgi:hypothetical protein
MQVVQDFATHLLLEPIAAERHSQSCVEPSNFRTRLSSSLTMEIRWTSMLHWSRCCKRLRRFAEDKGVYSRCCRHTSSTFGEQGSLRESGRIKCCFLTHRTSLRCKMTFGSFHIVATSTYYVGMSGTSARSCCGLIYVCVSSSFRNPLYPRSEFGDHSIA